MKGKLAKTWGKACVRKLRQIMRSKAATALFLMCLTVSAASITIAQTGFSTLRGNVKDTSGAFVPDAQVVLTEPATGITVRSTASDANGNFEFPNLKPGTYEVKAEAKGFKVFVAKEILLEAGQTRRLDVQLEVGGGTEVVEVRAGAAVINTEGGSISGDFDKVKFADSALIDTYPSPLAMFATLPGVQGNGWDLKISGQDASQQSIQMDGVSNDRTGEQSNNMNFFQEATVATVNATADSSRVVAYNLTSKRGENEFHGMVYYKHFNAGLNAKPHDGNPTKTPFIQHEWQGEIAGPVWKNKTFFYFSWMEQRIPLGSFNLATVPTQAMWNGDFTGFPTIHDPQTGQPFPNNKIPANRISPVAAALQKYYPLPNIGDPTVFTSNNFGWNHPYNSDFYQGDWPFFRIDHNLTKKNSLYVRWLQRKTPYVLPSGLPSTFWTRLRDHRQTVVADTHVFSSTLVNTFRFGWSTNYIVDGASEAGQKPLDGGDVIAAIGLQGVNPSNYNVAGVPSFSISHVSSFSGVNGGVKRDDNDFSSEDSVTWEKGRHIWKFGGELSTFKTFRGVVPDYGSVSFNGKFAGKTLGGGFADFLLGLPKSSRRSDPFVNRARTNKELGFYAMDTFKLTPKLTLDYGLRWDYYALPTYTDGLMYNFDPATRSVLIPPGTSGKVNPRYPPSIPLTTGQVVPEASLANFRPRISAAYRLGKDFVIRGGYGQFTERYSRFYFDLVNDPGPFAHLSESYTNTTVSPAPNFQPLFSLPNPFPTGTSSANPPPSQSVTALPKQWRNGTVHQFNLTLEKEIAKMGLRASYIGSRSVGLNYQYDSNVPQASTTPFDTSLQPFPNLSSVNVFRHDGKATYNSLQLEASRKQGWATFDAHYTLASSLNNILNTDNIYEPTKNWAVDSGLRRNFLTITSVLTLPFGKGRRYMNHAPRMVDTLLGGWSLQTISYFGSGDYLTPYFSGFDVANNNYNSFIPDVIPGTNGNLPVGQRTQDRWFNTPVYHQDPVSGNFVYDKIGAFKVPGCPDTDPLCLNTNLNTTTVGRFGNARINSLAGPGLNVHHLSIAKTFSLTERVNMTFTTAISDIFNRPHFYDPDTDITQQDVGQLIYSRGDFEPEKAGHRQISFKLRIAF